MRPRSASREPAVNLNRPSCRLGMAWSANLSRPWEFAAARTPACRHRSFRSGDRCGPDAFVLRQRYEKLAAEHHVRNAAASHCTTTSWRPSCHADPHGPRHIAAVNVFKQNYDSLAFPGGLKRGLADLKLGQAEAVEHAVRFMESDPLFNQSGYIKEEIIRRLKHVPLTPIQRGRLARVVLRSFSGGWQMPRKVARIAPRVDSPAFRKAVSVAAVNLSISEERIHANLVLHVLVIQPASRRHRLTSFAHRAGTAAIHFGGSMPKSRIDSRLSSL